MYIVVNNKRIDIVDFKQISTETPETTENTEQIRENFENKENYDNSSFFSDPLVITAIVLVVILIGFFLYIYFYEIKETETSPYNVSTEQEKFRAPGIDINIEPKSEFDQLMETMSAPSTPDLGSELLPFQKLRIPEIEKINYQDTIVPNRTTKIQLGTDIVPPPPVYTMQKIPENFENTITKLPSETLKKRETRQTNKRQTNRRTMSPISLI